SLGGGRPLFNHSMATAFAAAFVAAAQGRFDRTLAFQPAPGADLLFCADWIRDAVDVPAWRRMLPRHRAFAALEEACFAPGAPTRIIGLSGPQMDAYRLRYGTPDERIAIVPPTLSPAKRRPDRRTPEVRRSVRTALG